MTTYRFGYGYDSMTGIPSEDVAVTMLIDAWRYVDDSAKILERREVKISIEPIDDGCVPRPCVLDRDGRAVECVEPEHRCGHCGQVLRLP